MTPFVPPGPGRHLCVPQRCSGTVARLGDADLRLIPGARYVIIFLLVFLVLVFLIRKPARDRYTRESDAELPVPAVPVSVPSVPDIVPFTEPQARPVFERRGGVP